MTHKRNTTALVKAAKQRHQDTLKRAEKAIETLLSANKPVNFNTVAQSASIGKTWLYKESCIREKIESLRNQTKTLSQQASPSSVTTEHASEQSKNHIIKMLKDKVRALELDNKQLKQQIEKLYGEIYHAKEVEQ